MGLPYRAVLALAGLVLAARYVFDPKGSKGGRCVVALATAASFALPDGLRWYVTGVMIQLAVSLFVLLRAVALRGERP